MLRPPDARLSTSSVRKFSHCNRLVSWNSSIMMLWYCVPIRSNTNDASSPCIMLRSIIGVRARMKRLRSFDRRVTSVSIAPRSPIGVRLVIAKLMLLVRRAARSCSSLTMLSWWESCSAIGWSDVSLRSCDLNSFSESTVISERRFPNFCSMSPSFMLRMYLLTSPL